MTLINYRLVLYRIVLYCIVLYGIVLYYCIVLLYCIVLYFIVLSNVEVTVQKARETSTNIPRYCTVGYCTVPCARSSCYTK